MSYLQALNAGLLETADSNPSLDTVLTSGNTSSSSINLTGTGSLNLTGTGDITLTSGDITLTSGDITLTSGTLTCTEVDYGGNGNIIGDDVLGLVIDGAGDGNTITLNSITRISTSPLYFTYTACGVPSGNTVCGSNANYSTSNTVSLTGDASWRQLLLDTNVVVAGVYMLSANITYDTTDSYTIGNVIYIGIANLGGTTPQNGNKGGSPLNTGSITFCAPFVSTGTITTNNTVQFVYYTNMSNITVTSISWTLTRIG
jgi:hypothetical protein